MAYTDDFRIYYNTSIHPELTRLESSRRRRLRLMAFSGVLVVLIGIFHYAYPILPLTLTLLAIVGFFISYTFYRLQQFVQTFKPLVVRLILDYIDDFPNFGDLRYSPKKMIPEAVFRRSNLFFGPFQQYIGEDFIDGRIGEIDFELCELSVRQESMVRNRLNYIFQGAFMVARLQTPIKGSILLIPEAHKQYQSKTIRRAIERGMCEAAVAYQIPEFDDLFFTMTSPDVLVREILSADMQRLIIDFQKRSNEAVYFSYSDRYIYVAVTHKGDLLEPKLFQSNKSFPLIATFYTDLNLLLSIAEDFDRNH